MLNGRGEMTYCALFNNTECIDALEVSALSGPASHNQPRTRFPKENNHDCYLQKIPRNLKA